MILKLIKLGTYLFLLLKIIRESKLPCVTALSKVKDIKIIKGVETTIKQH